LVAHKVFTPGPGDPIDFEVTIERTILEWRNRFNLRKVYFDPFQMVSVAQRLAREGVQIQEYPQTVPNLTAATSNLFDLISARQLILYPDAAMRLAISRAIIHESSRFCPPARLGSIGCRRTRNSNRSPLPRMATILLASEVAS
jgi:hypothetical protein